MPYTSAVEKGKAPQGGRAGCLVLLFARRPLWGRVKTRLAAQIGHDRTLTLYKALLEDSIRSVRKSGFPFRFCLEQPEKGRPDLLTGRYEYMPQEGRDLGERMANAFARAFGEGIEKAVITGSDLPELPPEVITEAFDSLDHCSAVIGPARDGGYYLIGFTSGSFLQEVFRDIVWGVDTVFSKTMEIFNRHGYSVHVLREWQDIDTIGDLRDFLLRSRGGTGSGSATLSCLSRDPFYRKLLLRKTKRTPAG